MKKILLLIVLFHCALCAFSQNSLVKMWDRRFGGYLTEDLYCFLETSDGGFILAGNSKSDIGGDKTQPIVGGAGDWDYWIVKIDPVGNKLWDKTFGGTQYEELYAIQQTKDGGYIFGGRSFSGTGGDKSQPSVGDYDYWIVKTDSLGNKLWDKDFGGTSEDVLTAIQPTKDGGYILGGWSQSGISGDKTQGLWGNVGWDDDYWIIKIDSLGNKLWDKDFGWTYPDLLTCVTECIDGGILLGGYSNSGIGGDKTQNIWGTFPNCDYWIIKIDSLGNKLWDKNFGGLEDDRLITLRSTHDGGYILGGHSESGIGGDKSEITKGYFDYWIIRIDSLGNKQWDKDLGGDFTEWQYSLIQTNDEGFLISGTSFSTLSGDKSENNVGSSQTWVVKTDSLGNKKWDKTLFLNGESGFGFAIQTNHGCYAMANFTNAPISGYKTQPNWDTTNMNLDYWVVKFCEGPIISFSTITDICPGNCIDFLNYTSNAISYQWSFPGALPDTSTSTNPTNICYANPGSYDVQLIATNAIESDTLLLTNYITVYPFPPPQSITQSGDTLFAISGSSSYQWYFNGSIINGATDYFYVATSSGDYNVVATDTNGCEVEAVINNVVAGSSQLAVSSFQLAIFPNPVEDKFTIQKSQVTSGTAVEVSIYNVLGERVLIHESIGKIQEEIIDVSKLGSGMYSIEIISGENIYRGKFVKQ